MTRTEPCLMCGGSITAGPDFESIRVAVLTHNRSERHAMAREGSPTRTCPGCRMVTIPAWRERCHGCSREAVA